MIASLLLLGSSFAPLMASVSLSILRWRKARLGFWWLATFLGGAITWVCLLGLRFFLPHQVALVSWQPENLFPLSPELLADGFSWVVGFALATVGVAVIFTEATTPDAERALGWAGSSFLVGLGLIAIFAGNQLTLLLAWAAIDLVELLIWLSRPALPQLRERVILAFSSRAFAVMLALWGLDNPWAYVFSILLRWGVFPFHLPYLESPDLRRGLGTIIRIVPPLTTMPLLARLADLGYFSEQSWISVFLGLIALFAALQWINSAEVIEGRPFWIIGTASFAFYAANLQRPEAVIAWALVLALHGSFVFLIRGWERFWFPVFVYQSILLLGLPFTPFWDMMRVYRPTWSPANILWLLSHLLLIAGYVRFIFQKPLETVEGEPWRIVLYRMAFGGLIGSSLMIGYGGWRNSLETALSQPYLTSRNWMEYFGGLILALLSLLLAFLRRRRLLTRLRVPERLMRLFSMEWVYRFLQWGFRQLGGFYYQVEGVLEGKAGILWAIVLLLVLGRVFLFLGGGE
ncbi:MAG: hypothetical protein ANABAC_0609 [Anaerolineae bacterium]|nr:MAG: hypothetical protein ANABAC_0609 [Anaerolineae bacterium]